MSETFTWIDDKNKKHQYNLEKIESLFYKNKDSLSYKLAQSSSFLKGVLNFFRFKTELEKETDISVIQSKFQKENIDLNKTKNNTGDNLLLSAVKANNIPLMESLISMGVDLNSKGNRNQTALHIATELNNKDMVALLIDAKADVNIMGENNNTPLHIATEQNNKDMVALLIDAKADVNQKNKYGNTALHIAAQKQNTAMAKMLIEKGADVNLKTDSTEYTPLHYAVKTNNKDMVKLLIEKGADVNSRDASKQTPLHIAADKQNETIAKMLIDAKADVNLKNSDGKTASDFAVKNTDISKMLNEKVVNKNQRKTKTHIDIASNEQSIVNAGKKPNTSNMLQTVEEQEAELAQARKIRGAEQLKKQQELAQKVLPHKNTQEAGSLVGTKKSGAVQSEWKRGVINNTGRSRG